MFNLYRASQVLFPGEKILEDAGNFSSKYLRQKQPNNELLDKWIITKDLPGEVSYALDVPWYASLPRVETRFYLEQYGGKDDVWIGKTLYRMHEVNNNAYLELAKLDYNNCQAQHQAEWNNIQKWYRECNLGVFGISRENLLFAYFLAAASIFEAERSKERLAWAQSAILVEMVASHFNKEDTSREQRKAFLHEFKTNHATALDHTDRYKIQTGEGVVGTLVGALHQLSDVDAPEGHHRDIRHHLHHAWETWLMTWNKEAGGCQEAELLVRTINLCAGHLVSEEILSHPQYKLLSDLTNRVCHQLCEFKNNKVDGSCIDAKSGKITSIEIEVNMQELVQLVIQNSSNDIHSGIKQTFLAVAKSFYYNAYCDPNTINIHIAKILFQGVL